MTSGLVAFLQENLDKGNRYFCFRGRYRTFSWSFKKVSLFSGKFAAWLGEHKILRGDRILIIGSNCPEWVVAFLGSVMSGVVVVPVDASAGSRFLAKILNKAGARAVIAERQGSAGRLESVFINSKVPVLYFDEMESALAGQQLPDIPAYGVEGSDLAEIVFTSGTTSDPRGVMITHDNIHANLCSIKPVLDRWKKFFRLMRNLKLLSVVPLSHMYGQLIGIYIPVMIDSSVVFINSVNPAEIIRAIKDERIWILGVLPRILEVIKDHIVKNYGLDGASFRKKYDFLRKIKWPLRFIAFSGIHFRIGWRLVAIIVGGAAFNRSLDEFWRCIAYTVFQGYGLTETAPLVTLADPARTRAGYIGQVLEGQQLKLIDGEIYVKGPNVSPGYFMDTARTREAISNGWFRTGDLAEIEEDGNLVFKGRKDEIIVRPDGINVYPEDIESVLKSFAEVADAVVFGFAGGGSLEIHAVLMLAGDSGKQSLSAGKLIESANRRLNVYQHINSFSIWEGGDFPRTSTAKVRRGEVAKEVLSNRAEQIIKAGSKQASEGGKEKPSLISEMLGAAGKMMPGKIKKGAKLGQDLGLDSLDMIRLAGAIEDKYHIDIEGQRITGDTTVDEIEEIIKSPPEKTHRFPFYKFPYSLPVVIIRAFFQCILRLFICFIFRLKVEGIENVLSLKEPGVFAANHTSNMDTFAVLYSLPACIRAKVSTLMSIEYHFNHFFYRTGSWWRRAAEAAGFYLIVNLFINICPLSRTHGYRQVMENIGRLLSEGWSILIYPEGMVTTDGKMREFEQGVGMISSGMKARVVPVRIEGLYNILRNGILPWGYRPRWPKVVVSFGKPIDYHGRGYREITREVEKAVRKI